MPKRKTPYRSKVKIGVDQDGRPINNYKNNNSFKN